MNAELHFLAFSSGPTSLLATNKSLCTFLYNIHLFGQQINIIYADPKLVCPIQFQSLLGLLGPYKWNMLKQLYIHATVHRNGFLFK
jgi:hypothetical protein